jgi:hypothetical protein
VKRDMLARIHEGEGFLVVPRDEMGGLAFGSFARGTEDGGGDIFERRDRDVSVLLPTAGGDTTGGMTSTGGGSAIEQLVEAASKPSVNVTYAPTVQIQDNSLVRTVEGQKRFERETVGVVTEALRQGNSGLEEQIARIVRREVA